MGIKGLKKFLRTKFPTHEKTVEVSSLSGTKLAVDADLLLTRFVKTYPTVSGPVFQFVAKLRGHNVHPVFVFDGPKKLDLKQKAWDERAVQSASTLARLVSQNDIVDHIRGALQCDPDAVCDEVVEDQLKRREKLELQTRHLTRDIREKVKKTLDAVGVPHLQAVGEGEQLCSYMCRTGLVDAVYSEDGDCMAFGAPRIVYRYNYASDTVTCVDLSDLLARMGFTYDLFVSFCIMCGTDFNKNIPKIGPAKAYALLKTHGSFEALEAASALPLATLNHDVLHDFFSKEPMTLPDRVEWCESHVPLARYFGVTGVAEEDLWYGAHGEDLDWVGVATLKLYVSNFCGRETEVVRDEDAFRHSTHT